MYEPLSPLLFFFFSTIDYQFIRLYAENNRGLEKTAGRWTLNGDTALVRVKEQNFHDEMFGLVL